LNCIFKTTKPHWQILGRLRVRQIVDQNEGISTPIINGTKRCVSLHSCCVPQLQFNGLVAQLAREYRVASTNCQLVVWIEIMTDASYRQTRFAHRH
jgi:hypothetical protein